MACSLLLVPAGGASDNASGADGVLFANPLGRSSDGVAHVALSSKDGIAKATVSVPPGYRARLNQRPGVRVGRFLNVLLVSTTGSAERWATGVLVADAPAR
jgi:hypothetical protein